MSSDVKWTKDQLDAIERKGGSIVVSAAAGSGKTAVLVERVIRLLTDEENPVLPEKLLIVTFTKAAASEMKYKIKAALREKAKENKTARRALNNIDSAVISTMDSFCSRLVKENFESAGVSPDFKILDDAELKMITDNALNDVLESYYSSDDSAFNSLFKLFLARSDDRKLHSCIAELYKFSRSYPYPDEWLDSVVSCYKNASSPFESVWGKYISETLKNNFEYINFLLKKCADIAESEEAVAVSYCPAVYADIDRFDDAYKTVLYSDDWETVKNAVLPLKTLTRLPGKKGIGEYSQAKAVKDIRSQISSSVKKLLQLVCYTEKDFREDIDFLAPVIEKIVEITKKFAVEIAVKKNERNSYHFNDILHFAIELMYKKTENGYVKTALSEKISKAYDAVLIDEYQDTTRAQDSLFYAISDSGQKMFVVGDVKQSIYGFRLATPDIFIEKCDNSYRCDENKFPMRIILGKNFRSRAGILDFVNFVFAQIMSSETGGVNYNEDEYLYYGGSEPGEMNDVDVLLCNAPQDTYVAECENIAEYINRKISEKTLIKVKGEERELRYSDFCVLLRAVSGKASVLADILYSHNIPVVYEKEEDCFLSPETRVLLALINIIDNPRSDVDLLSILFFPMFGFSPDELAEIRMSGSGSLFDCLLVRSAVDRKCADFLDFLSDVRKCSLSMKTSDFIRYLIFETDFASMTASMPQGENRLSSLNRFIDYAAAYENSGRFGYSGFVKYLNKIKSSGALIKINDSKGDIENAVKIMSVHKSKGLEFPYVILADTAKSFNASDRRERLLIDSNYGLALNLQDRQNLAKYETIPYAVIKKVKADNSSNEELRLLYVALTRASVKLVISVCSKNLTSLISKANARISLTEKAEPNSVKQCSSYADMLVIAILKHPDSDILRDMVQSDCEPLPCSSKMNIYINDFSDFAAPEKNSEEKNGHLIRKPFSENEFKQCAEAIEYEYPYSYLDGIPAKISASGFHSGSKDYVRLNLTSPTFSVTDSLSGTDRGRAYHKFLQNCDFKALAENVDSEKQRLLEEGYITENEFKLVSTQKLKSFINSDVGSEILSADRIYREYEFRLMIPVKELYSDIESTEKILVQGVADLIYFHNNNAVVVDYKTDANCDEEHLISLYRTQLLIYRYAVEKLMDIKVNGTYLYSLSASKRITID